MKKPCFFFLLIVFSTFSLAQERVRVMSYNLHNYGTDNSTHDADFKTVISQLQPDIFVAVEMMTQDGVNKFLQNVLDPNYQAVNVSVTGGTGNDCAAYYNETKINYLGTVQHWSDPRDICEFRFASKATGDTLIVFGVHLKAFNDFTSAERRAAAAQVLRNFTNNYGTKKNYLVCGDFNIFTSEEDAFKKLLDKSTPGYFYDPQNALGNWTENGSFSSTHSYSPQYLTTRLDMILYSEALKQSGGVDYVEDSYKIYGNDGAHFRKAISSGTNYWLWFSGLGTALENASDHLPVYADFDFGVSTSVNCNPTIPNVFSLFQNYPNPFNPSTNINFSIPVNSKVSIKIFDLLGREVSTLIDEFRPAGNYSVSFTPKELTSGVYYYQLRSDKMIITKKLIYLK